MATEVLNRRILLAEDECHLAQGISYNLEKRGFDVTVATRGDEALGLATREAFDLLILDVMMPGLSGFEVCSALRAQEILVPILMLTARHELENRVKGLRLGADDYLGKPFELEELITRVHALLRRSGWSNPAAAQPATTWAMGQVIFDSNRLELRGPKDQLVQLTAIESRLLQLLASHPGRTLARVKILKAVWGLHEDTQTRTLDNFIMRLRNHLTRVGGSGEHIESVRGVGYRFKADP